jgi:hypothetical protein
MLYQKGEMVLADVRATRALIDEFLGVAKLVLDHPEQCLEPWGLLFPEKAFDGL